MEKLNYYFNKASQKSNFTCNLGRLGGFVNFKNRGKGGAAKEFTLSLESILSGLKDIKINLEAFKNLTNYNEGEWRNNGSKYFTDPVFNSMITVQTKSCFCTLSKIINWATEADASKYDDNLIDLNLESIDAAINKLEALSLSFSPKKYIVAGAKIAHHSNEPCLDAISLPKPFLLLAGISGTGKTRFVREQAKATKKFNETYCLTSVRPDWHEPSDVLGYISRLNGQAEYVTTDVLQFITKAWRAIAEAGLTIEVQQGERLVVSGERDTLEAVHPYWLCLDEMNLAPVEQYFADYLSVLETREWHWEGDSFTYASDALLKSSTIKALEDNSKLRKSLGFEDSTYNDMWALICQHGLGIPFNLMVAGTVNMDETTHGFSRKVIDRALSFDFGEFFPNDFDDFFAQKSHNKSLSYPILSQVCQADLASTFDKDGIKSIAFLSAVNLVLKNTPFELAYRALNEMLLAVVSAQPQDELMLNAVWDDFLMSKVLPRIEGDVDKLSNGPLSNEDSLLTRLETVLCAQLSPIWHQEKGSATARPDLYREKIVADGASDAEKIIRITCRSRSKLKWMSDRLLSVGFTSFWP